MSERIITTLEVKEFLTPYQGQKVTLDMIRKEFRITKESPKSFEAIRNIMWQLQGIWTKPTGRPGEYKILRQVKPIKVFGRERRPEIKLNPPVDRETMEPLGFFNDIIFRENDAIGLFGFKNKGKTGMCMNVIGENLDKDPVLMGNEYTVMGKDGEYEVAPRMANRFDNMDWVQWTNGDGGERFELLPVYADFAEHIRAGRLNVIDWINLPGEYYMVSPVIEGIKQAVGSGIVLVVLQKNPGMEYGRGGNPSKDFIDVEILLDPYGDDPNMTLLTVGTVKESRNPVMGRKFVYRMKKGVEIVDFREVQRCPKCHGKKWYGQKPCECRTGYVDMKIGG